MAKDTFESHDELDQPATAKDALGSALIILTAVMLLGAIFLMQKAMAQKFNAGMFGEPTATK